MVAFTRIIPRKSHIDDLNELQIGLEDRGISPTDPFWDCPWDGVADGYAELQAFVTYVVANKIRGVLPPGNCLISDSIDFSLMPGWAIDGAGRGLTTITQNTDNIPIFNLGSDAASSMHSWRISGINFTYTNNQPAANTNANPVAFSKMGYGFTLRDLTFSRGSYGIRLVAALEAPWGGAWDELTFTSGLTIGAIDTSLGTSACPNNQWGRMLVDAANMVGPIFKVHGYDWTIDTIEILTANQGPQWLVLKAGSEVVIGALKLENGQYAANQTLIDCPTNAILDIGHLTIGGNAMDVTSSAAVSVINSAIGGSGGRVKVDFMRLDPTSVTGALNGFAGGALDGGRWCGHFKATNGARLTNNSSAVTNESLQVQTYLNNRLSANKGDADYAVTLGDPNIIHYSTALTAIRTVTLPSDGNNLHNGLYYEVVIGTGVVNGANTLLIKSAAATLHTETSDKRVIRFTWRRHTTASSGWVMTHYETLP